MSRAWNPKTSRRRPKIYSRTTNLSNRWIRRQLKRKLTTTPLNRWTNTCQRNCVYRKPENSRTRASLDANVTMMAIQLASETRTPFSILGLYEVEFPDGSTDTFSVNIIAENLFSQVDNEGHAYQIMKEVVDHRKNERTAVSKDDGMVRTRSGTLRPRITTSGWELLVEWMDGSTSWIPLKDLKHSNPLEVAEYAVANKIAEEPAFCWWVRQTLRRRDRIIKKVKTRYWRRTHKYGVELPKTVTEALEIDARTGNHVLDKSN